MHRTVTLKDLIKYYECSLSTAKIRLKQIKTACQKDRITVYDFAIYEGYPPEVIKDYLNG
ncbi:hypothetical protein GGR21_002994 [Dysgonomonas hofstadii]|uniref:Uncharacterized protein n=1 Tax=Dysgonomonas hofstadii TaxID=637886 RepID=A0A840CQY2_9BACT|nr:hypothetical protein [Dysgonomonas hofstadii]